MSRTTAALARTFILHPSSFIILLVFCARLSAQDVITINPETPGCSFGFFAADLCSEGAIGNGAPTTFLGLSKDEVQAIVEEAAAALAVDTATIAVVDRAGRPLAVFRQLHADPNNDNLAVGVARTAAFFSHNQAPLSSRTVRFISGIHFPPGVVNASNAALYGIENTNRGCDLNIKWNTTLISSQCMPRARSFKNSGLPCDFSTRAGCGPGIVTGKQQPDDGDSGSLNAGGIPLYRIPPDGLVDATEGRVSQGKLVGGIGVVGIGGDPQLAEFAAVTGAFGALNQGKGPIVPVPQYPLPQPGNVFIDGVRLPFLGTDQRLAFNSDGLPIGLQRPDGTSPGTKSGAFVFGPSFGGCAANGYLAGPYAGGALSMADVDGIVQRAVAAAKKTRGGIRLPLNSYARMVISVADTEGNILALYRMPDATVFSIDVAVAKARNVVYFSTDATDLDGVPGGTAVTNRTIGFGAQPLFPPGIDSDVFDVDPGPFFDLFLFDLANPCSQGSQPPNPNQSGIVFFPGATPLYSGNTLAGGLGVSGDGVEQDDYVTYLAAGSFLPPKSKWADRVKVDRVRLPMFKFPRHPEGVTECGGKPCS
ncbi:MAG TPA: heme-binding protein [Thermoanaerobaculia bacterium]|nr:heme-binding protein [Thermoanaerobaculia bacterium]